MRYIVHNSIITGIVGIVYWLIQCPIIVVIGSVPSPSRRITFITSKSSLNYHDDDTGYTFMKRSNSKYPFTNNILLPHLLNHVRGGAGLNATNVDIDTDDDDTNDKNDVNDSDDDKKESSNDKECKNTVLFNGSFKDALQYSKHNGRILIVFIPQLPNPSSTVTKDKDNMNDIKSIDNTIMTSLTSQEVIKKAQQLPPISKKIKQQFNNINNSNSNKNNNMNTGSFVIWYCANGISSSEATTILKSIRGSSNTIQYKNAAGQKRPILIAIYPYMNSQNGNNIILPKLLVQHHCSPPPPTKLKFVEWLQTIRIRYKKYYIKMYKQILEQQWEQQRKIGYKDSIQTDIEMKQREIIQQQEQKRIIQQQQEHIAYIQQRRKQLLQSLHNVTVTDNDTTNTSNSNNITTTIALRFHDGRTDQRKFNHYATIQDIFYWIDAIHEIQYETIILQTMNGKRTFTWNKTNKQSNDDDDENQSNDNNDDDDENYLQMPIHEAGLGKMVGLRVLTKPTNATSTKSSK